MRLAAIDASGVPTAWNPGATDIVRAMAVSGTTLYVGGLFDSIGGQVGHPNLARFDANGAVCRGALTPTRRSTRSRSAAGSCTRVVSSPRIGGKQRSHIGAVDATTGLATAWNPSADADVYALAPVGSTVYAGGAFTSIGGQPRSSLAALDANGAATPWDPTPFGPVYALSASETSIYARGQVRVRGRGPVQQRGEHRRQWPPHGLDGGPKRRPQLRACVARAAPDRCTWAAISRWSVPRRAQAWRSSFRDGLT